jgi:hypothetical protein
MKNSRMINGYVVIYKPEHPKAMKSKNWEGYIYEHIYIAEHELGREIRQDEVVHHLDLCRDHNWAGNLLVLPNSEHVKLHSWIEDNNIKPIQKENKNTYCKRCGKVLKTSNEEYCSLSCSNKNRGDSPKYRKVLNRPDKETLNTIISSGRSLVSIGKDYGVSDNTIRKWAKNYGIETRKSFKKIIVRYSK